MLSVMQHCKPEFTESSAKPILNPCRIQMYSFHCQVPPTLTKYIIQNASLLHLLALGSGTQSSFDICQLFLWIHSVKHKLLSALGKIMENNNCGILNAAFSVLVWRWVQIHSYSFSVQIRNDHIMLTLWLHIAYKWACNFYLHFIDQKKKV